MRQAFSTRANGLKSVLASLMAALVVLLSLFAASENLHQELHSSSGGHYHGSCAVCRLVEGQVDVPVTSVTEILVPVSISWTVPHSENAEPHSPDFSVASSRGPPPIVSSL